jgi:hypothetical protein
VNFFGIQVNFSVIEGEVTTLVEGVKVPLHKGFKKVIFENRLRI